MYYLYFEMNGVALEYTVPYFNAFLEEALAKATGEKPASDIL